MLKNDIYNIDKEFDYTTVKSIVLKSLNKIAKQQVLKNIHNDVIFDSKDNDDLPVNVNNLLAPYFSIIKAENQKYDKISELAYCCFK
jgi:hypothetical protein